MVSGKDNKQQECGECGECDEKFGAGRRFASRYHDERKRLKELNDLKTDFLFRARMNCLTEVNKSRLCE
jgi:hypothetical protein